MEKIKRDLYGGRFLAAIIITTLLFLLVFYFSNEIIRNKSVSINEEQQSLYYLFVLEQIKSEFAHTCNNLSFNELSEELGRMGEYLDIMEKKVGKDNLEEIQYEKEMYSALEIQHFILSKKKNELCGEVDNPLLLFFYSNNQNYLTEAERIGAILTNIKEDNPEVLIYSFDIDLNFNLIDYLRREFNVTETNTVVIDENKVVSPKNNDEIYDLLNL